MRLIRHCAPVLCVAAACLAWLPAAPSAQPARTMAVTLDDGPYIGGGSHGAYVQRAGAATTRLLAALRAHRAPAVLFVNEQQLEGVGQADIAARTALMARWLDAGHALGNHTFSHPDANALTADAFAADIARGDRATRQLLKSRGAAPPRFFRHPYTHTGDTVEKKRAIAAALAARGYVITPHTVENADWLFNTGYQRALEAGDAAGSRRLADAYLAHTQRVVAFAEAMSAQLFDREIAQVLLIHANGLNADVLGTVLADLSGRGYRFVSLEEAMRDPAYRTPDTWVGRHGPTWLFRWSRSLGRQVSFADEPEPPAWVSAAAQ